ncbi:uncharacterized protein C8A04DRAFT_14954 [Dichotomopilus funicola]|uniref:DNA primase n=1 Tax=Dichotomopilus funicola TaxID=1934379 RepID=A0AAN6UWC5_9PEZI|nr:hypothetical protein C8A04DRAFT_14954 [Dichotomopilus funicola]
MEDAPAAVVDSPAAVDDTAMADAADAQAATEDVKPADESSQPAKESNGTKAAEIKQEEKQEVKLEDLFDGIDSDDDLSLPEDGQEPQQPELADTPGASIELLRAYYQRFFPWRYMFQWLNHSPVPTNDFKHREFSLWLHNDAVMRYQSFPTSDLFRKDVLRLMPRRIEIGPVYTADPRDRKTFRNSAAFQPIAKELCFDIDLTDYDDIRTCCDKANICNKCWKFTTMAIKVLDTALREDFGFNHILWVYSGRRGVHAWVCDRKARTLADQHRKAITAYFEVIAGKQGGKRVNVRRPLHPHLSRSIEILKDHFQEDVLEIQDPWQSSEKAEYLLQQIPDLQLRDALRKKWDSSPGRASTSKWADIDALARTDASGGLDAHSLLDAKQDILLEYTYPRLDIAVSQRLNHLLKSPFVIHPGTGRVCVPIDRNNLDAFDPLDVPTLPRLVREIDEWAETEGASRAMAAVEVSDGAAVGGSSSQDVKPVPDWEKTSLKPYIEHFRSFVATLMRDERETAVKRERDEDGDVQIKTESLDF